MYRGYLSKRDNRHLDRSLRSGEISMEKELLLRIKRFLHALALSRNDGCCKLVETYNYKLKENDVPCLITLST